MITTEGTPNPCVTFFKRRQDSDCQRCAMRSSALFADLRPIDIEWATRHIENGILGRDGLIYQGGTAGDGIYTVRVGMVKLLLDLPGHEPRIVRLLGRGATLGLERLAGKPYAHTAISLRTTNLCRIPIAVIRELHQTNPRLLNGLMVKWEEQLAWADRWISVLGAGPVERRIVELVRFVRDISGDPLEAVQLPSTGDLAAILGVSVESTSRQMAQLKRRRILVRVSPWTYGFNPALLDDGPSGADQEPPPEGIRGKLRAVRREREAASARQRRTRRTPGP